MMFVMLGLLVFIASANSTIAKSAARGSQKTPGIVTNESQGLGPKHSTEPKIQRLRLLRSKAALNAVSSKVPTKGCGCLAMSDASGSGFGTCLKNCMADAGVSAYSLAMCGGACALAWTGGGALICALCVGISVTVVEVCALGCATYGGKEIGSLLEARNIKHRKAPLRSSYGIGLRQVKA
jgi:hypothetical protein